MRYERGKGAYRRRGHSFGTKARQQRHGRLRKLHPIRLWLHLTAGLCDSHFHRTAGSLHTVAAGFLSRSRLMMRQNASRSRSEQREHKKCRRCHPVECDHSLSVYDQR